MSDVKHNLSIEDQLWTSIKIPIIFLFSGVVINHTLNTSCPYEIHTNPFYWTGGLIIFNVETGDWYEVEGEKPTVYLNIFDNYALNVLRTGNT